MAALPASAFAAANIYFYNYNDDFFIPEKNPLKEMTEWEDVINGKEPEQAWIGCETCGVKYRGYDGWRFCREESNGYKIYKKMLDDCSVYQLMLPLAKYCYVCDRCIHKNPTDYGLEKKKRKCSKCNQAGHTKRSCKD
jgi:hypothetical protein